MEIRGRGQVQLMNDDGIDSHVPPLLSFSACHRHQREPRDCKALQWAVAVSATWCGICWYVASSDDGEGVVQLMNDNGIDSHVPPLLSFPSLRSSPPANATGSTSIAVGRDGKCDVVWYLLVCRLVR